MSRHATPTTRAQRRRLEFVVMAAGLAAAVVLATGFSGTLSVFTQAFVHGTNTVATTELRIAETTIDGATERCSLDESGTSQCRDDLYGGQVLRPGGSSTQTVYFTNSGQTTPSAFRLTGDACSTRPDRGAALCDELLVTITWRDEDVSPARQMTPSSLAAQPVVVSDPPAPGETIPLTVRVELPQSASAPTSGVTLSQPLSFTFSA